MSSSPEADDTSAEKREIVANLMKQVEDHSDRLEPQIRASIEDLRRPLRKLVRRLERKNNTTTESRDEMARSFARDIHALTSSRAEARTTIIERLKEHCSKLDEVCLKLRLLDSYEAHQVWKMAEPARDTVNDLFIRGASRSLYAGIWLLADWSIEHYARIWWT